MDPEYSAREETSERRDPLPMFVAPADDYEQRGVFESDSHRTDKSAPVEHDWVTERVMDSYN